MEEIEIKNKEISSLHNKVQMLQNSANKLESLKRENNRLRNDNSQKANVIEELQHSKDRYDNSSKSLAAEIKELEVEINVLRSENVNTKRLNEVLCDQSQFLKEQIKGKDSIISSLLKNQDATSPPKNIENNQAQQNSTKVSNQVLIMGDSIIKLIDPDKLLMRNPEIKVDKITTYTWEEATAAVTNPDLTIPNNVVLHVGTKGQQVNRNYHGVSQENSSSDT